MFLKLPPSDVPLFHSCGCLVSNEPFLHADRMNSDYLLIIGMKETLHLLVNDEPVDVAPHEMLIIPPFTPHCGKAPSENITFFGAIFGFLETNNSFPTRKRLTCMSSFPTIEAKKQR